MLNDKNLCGIGILLVLLMAACQTDDALPYEYNNRFSARISALPGEVRVYDSLLLAIEQPVVSAHWHATQGGGSLITPEGSRPLLRSETIALPVTLLPSTTTYLPRRENTRVGLRYKTSWAR